MTNPPSARAPHPTAHNPASHAAPTVDNPSTPENPSTPTVPTAGSNTAATSVTASAPPEDPQSQVETLPMEGTQQTPATSPEHSDVVRAYHKSRHKKLLIICALFTAALLAFVIATIVGPISLTPSEVFRGIINPSSVDSTTQTVLWDLRLPSSVMAVLVGASLSLSGAHMQTILDNPLAEPFTLGISAAAAFGGAASIVLGWHVLANPQFNLASVAWVVSLVAVMIVTGASIWRGGSAESMILLGIALVFLFQALLSLVQYYATTEALQQIVFWTLGSLQRATWISNGLIFAGLAIAVPYTAWNSWKLTALRLSEARAASLGINVMRLRITTLIISSLLAASSVAFAGIIGFIGLVGPHVARMLVGEDQRFFIPASMASGALLLAGAHAVSITVIPGVAVPIGIITALVGVPFFVTLIFLRRRTIWSS